MSTARPDGAAIREAMVKLERFRYTAAISRGEKNYTTFDRDESLALLAELDALLVERDEAQRRAGEAESLAAAFKANRDGQREARRFNARKGLEWMKRAQEAERLRDEALAAIREIASMPVAEGPGVRMRSLARAVLAAVPGDTPGKDLGGASGARAEVADTSGTERSEA